MVDLKEKLLYTRQSNVDGIARDVLRVYDSPMEQNDGSIYKQKVVAKVKYKNFQRDEAGKPQYNIIYEVRSWYSKKDFDAIQDFLGLEVSSHPDKNISPPKK